MIKLWHKYLDFISPYIPIWRLSGRGRIRTCVDYRQRSYSPSPLATQPLSQHTQNAHIHMHIYIKYTEICMLYRDSSTLLYVSHRPLCYTYVEQVTQLVRVHA